jgi:hypothetical protein
MQMFVWQQTLLDFTANAPPAIAGDYLTKSDGVRLELEHLRELHERREQPRPAARHGRVEAAAL